MLRRLTFAAFLVSLAPAAALTAADPAPRFLRLSSPAGASSIAPDMASANDGTIWLSWVEPTANGHRLVCASFDAGRSRWYEAREIARGLNWSVSDANTPQLAAGADGRLAAVWFINNASDSHHRHGDHRAWASRSDDSGATWSAPEPLSRDSTTNEFVSIAPLPDGSWLAVWLDGRTKGTNGGATQLYGRVLGADEPEELLDDRVCDCCPTSLALLPDGSAYAAYRNRSNNEIRDLAAMQWREGNWSLATGLPADGWKIEGCPVNGPMLSRAGSRLGLVWFTAAGDTPRIMASVSTSFARQWALPRRLDRGAVPAGRVGGVLLSDGSLWASWLEADGQLALARLSPTSEPGDVHRVSTSPGGNARAEGTPRLIRLPTAPQAATRLLLVSTTSRSGEKPGGVVTHLVEVPAATAEEHCGCNQAAEATEQGHPLRGRVIRLIEEHESVLVAHEAIPRVMPAMTMAFRIDPRLLLFLEPDQEILARMERRADGKWWLFNVRILRPGDD